MESVRITKLNAKGYSEPQLNIDTNIHTQTYIPQVF